MPILQESIRGSNRTDLKYFTNELYDDIFVSIDQTSFRPHFPSQQQNRVDQMNGRVFYGMGIRANYSKSVTR